MKTASILLAALIASVACVEISRPVWADDWLKPCSEPPDRDIEKAIAACTDMIGNKKNDQKTVAFAHMHRGKWLAGKKDWTGAYKDLDQAIILLRSLAFYLTKAEVQMAQGDHAAAIATYDEALSKLPRDTNYPQIHSGRGDAFLSAGQKERAIADFKRAFKINPGDTATWEKLKALGVEVGPSPPSDSGQGSDYWDEDPD